MSNPNTPNPGQLELIHSKQNLKTNPARYENEAEPEYLDPPYPTIVLGPNAVYIVDASYWPGKAEEIKPQAPPALTSIEPSQLPVWAQDTEVFFHGTGFTEQSMIVWNNGEEPTKFLSPEKHSTIVKPSTVQAPLPYTLKTYVMTGEQKTTELDFTFIT